MRPRGSNTCVIEITDLGAEKPTPERYSICDVDRTNALQELRTALYPTNAPAAGSKGIRVIVAFDDQVAIDVLLPNCPEGRAAVAKTRQILDL